MQLLLTFFNGENFAALRDTAAAIHIAILTDINIVMYSESNTLCENSCSYVDSSIRFYMQ